MSPERKKREDGEPEAWGAVLLVLTSPCYTEEGADSLSGRPQVGGVQAWPPAVRNTERVQASGPQTRKTDPYVPGRVQKSCEGSGLTRGADIQGRGPCRVSRGHPLGCSRDRSS